MRSDGVNRITQVACCRQHSLVLTIEGDVCSFGRGSLGRLGLGGTADALTPQPIKLASHASSPRAQASSPSRGPRCAAVSTYLQGSSIRWRWC